MYLKKIFFFYFSEDAEAYKIAICFYSMLAFLLLLLLFIFMFWLKFRNYAKEKLEKKKISFKLF